MVLNRLGSIPSRAWGHHCHALKQKRYLSSQNINAQQELKRSTCMAETGAHSLGLGSFESQEPEQLGVTWNPYFATPLIDGSRNVRQLIKVHCTPNIHGRCICFVNANMARTEYSS